MEDTMPISNDTGGKLPHTIKPELTWVITKTTHTSIRSQDIMKIVEIQIYNSVSGVGTTAKHLIDTHKLMRPLFPRVYVLDKRIENPGSLPALVSIFYDLMATPLPEKDTPVSDHWCYAILMDYYHLIWFDGRLGKINNNGVWLSYHEGVDKETAFRLFSDIHTTLLEHFK